MDTLKKMMTRSSSKASQSSDKDKDPTKKTTNPRVIMIVDETGSMMSNKAVTISSYNEFLQTQANSATEDEEATDVTAFTLVKFNTNSRTNEYKDIKEAPMMTDKTYNPTNMTALYDAICDTLQNYKDEEDNICAIITDGAENSSRRYNRKQAMDMIKEFTDKKGWLFNFLACNMDAMAVGSGMNIAANQCQSFAASEDGFRDAYARNEVQMQAQRGYQRYKRKAMYSKQVDNSAPPPEFENFDSYFAAKGSSIQANVQKEKMSRNVKK